MWWTVGTEVNFYVSRFPSLNSQPTGSYCHLSFAFHFFTSFWFNEESCTRRVGGCSCRHRMHSPILLIAGEKHSGETSRGGVPPPIFSGLERGLHGHMGARYSTTLSLLHSFANPFTEEHLAGCQELLGSFEEAHPTPPIPTKRRYMLLCCNYERCVDADVVGFQGIGRHT